MNEIKAWNDINSKVDNKYPPIESGTIYSFVKSSPITCFGPTGIIFGIQIGSTGSTGSIGGPPGLIAIS